MSISDHAAAPAAEPSVSSWPLPEKSTDPAVSQRQRLAGLLIVLKVAFLPWILTSVLMLQGIDIGLFRQHYSLPVL
jgi:hypothetical protein